MKNRFIKIPVLFALLATGFQQPVQAAQLEPKKLDPHTTIIAWDVDGVLLKDRTRENKKWLAEHLQFAQAMDSSKKKHKLSDTIDIINAVAQDFPNLAKQAEEFKDLSTKAPRIEGITAALAQLQKAGYHQAFD